MHRSVDRLVGLLLVSLHSILFQRCRFWKRNRAGLEFDMNRSYLSSFYQADLIKKCIYVIRSRPIKDESRRDVNIALFGTATIFGHDCTINALSRRSCLRIANI